MISIEKLRAQRREHRSEERAIRGIGAVTLAFGALLDGKAIGEMTYRHDHLAHAVPFFAGLAVTAFGIYTTGYANSEGRQADTIEAEILRQGESIEEPPVALPAPAEAPE